MPKITRRAFAASSAAAAAAAAFGFKPALAQAYPARPVTVIVPWSAGGGTDATARIVAALLEKDLGQPFNVVNRTGGSGVVGHSAIASGTPDGYTIGMLTVEISMMHWQGLTELAPTSYTPLALMNEDPPGIQVGSASPYKTVKELADAIKAAPVGKFKASGTGQGGIWHLALVGWMQAMGLPANQVAWVPSNGAAPAMQDLAAGGLDLTTCSIPEARAIIEAGKARSLAVMAPARNPHLRQCTDAEGGDGHRLCDRRVARHCGAEGFARGCRDQTHGIIEEGFRLQRVQGVHEQSRLRNGVGRCGAIRDIHGQRRCPNGCGDEGRRPRQGLTRPVCSLARKSVGLGLCVFPIASRDRFSLSSAEPPPMAAGCCRQCPASRSAPTYFRW